MPRPSSIGIVMHDFPLGGTERIALRLARAWGAMGVAVTIFCGDKTGPLLTLAPENARIVEADPPIPRDANPRWNSSRQMLGKAAARFFADEPVDGVFVIGNFHWEIVPPIAAIGAGRPTILAQVSSPVRMPQRGWLLQRLFRSRMRRLLRDADGLVTLENVAAGQANAIMGKAVARSIALPALDDDVPSPAPPIADPVLLAAGRFVPQKDFLTLIRAFGDLPAGTRLVIAGSGPGEGEMKRLAVSLGVADRISFVGYVPDIRSLLDQARLFVLSSAFEGYAAVLVEALAAGRPIAATDCAPAVGMLLGDRPWGRIVPIGDTRGLSIAIAELLAAEDSDPHVIAATVAHHRLQPSAEAYLDLFADARR